MWEPALGHFLYTLHYWTLIFAPSPPFFYLIFFMCMDILPECMSVGHVHVVSMEGRRVTAGCEPPCGFWVLSKSSHFSSSCFVFLSFPGFQLGTSTLVLQAMFCSLLCTLFPLLCAHEGAQVLLHQKGQARQPKLYLILTLEPTLEGENYIPQVILWLPLSSHGIFTHVPHTHRLW